MTVLQIEHRIQNFDSWKKAFDSDPINRKESRTRRYRIYQPTNDSQYIIIDLEFDNVSDAEAALVKLQNLWSKVEGTVAFGPKARMLQLKDKLEY